jgi:hypothetical protein
MTLATQVAEVSRSISLDSAATDYTKFVKIRLVVGILARNGILNDALALATPRGASSRLQAMLKTPPGVIGEFTKQIMLPPGPADYEKLLKQTVQKSAVSVGGVDTGTWGSELAPFAESAAGFVQSLTPFSAFDRILSDGAFTRVPLRTRVVFASSAAIGSTVSEGTIKPLGALSFSYENLTAHKAIAEVVVTDELALSMSPASTSKIQTDLAKEVAKATDEKFLEIVSQSTGVASNPSTGLAAAQVLADLNTALQAIQVGVGSRLYLVLPMSVFHTVSLLRDGGALVVNGMIGNVRIIPTSASISDGVLLDASAVAADSEIVITEVSRESDVRLDDNPTSGTYRYVSLWANNLQLTRTERYFGASVLRSDGIAVISNMTT